MFQIRETLYFTIHTRIWNCDIYIIHMIYQTVVPSELISEGRQFLDSTKSPRNVSKVSLGRRNVLRISLRTLFGGLRCLSYFNSRYFLNSFSLQLSRSYWNIDRNKNWSSRHASRDAPFTHLHCSLRTHSGQVSQQGISLLCTLHRRLRNS